MHDPILSLAHSVYNNKGVYALLLGSGVSRSAGIPTGWEILVDLTQRVATMDEGKPVAEPIAWYRQKFGETPNYSKLLKRLAPTPAERQGLLRRYFEPTTDAEQHGLKRPQAVG